TVHLGYDFAPIPGETAVTLITSGADQVLRVVAKLDDPHAHVRKRFDRAQVVLECLRILEPEDDSGPARFLCLLDVRTGSYQRNEIGVVADQALHLRDIGHRILETFPDG